MSASLKSCETASWLNVSVFSSSFLAFGMAERADWLPPRPNFFEVSTSAPERRAAFTSWLLLAALPFGPLFCQTTGAQSWAPCKDGPLGIVEGRRTRRAGEEAVAFRP